MHFACLTQILEGMTLVYKRWSTLHILAPRRALFWRDAIAQAFLAITPRLGRLDDFQDVMIPRTVDSLSLNEVNGPTHGVSRTSTDLAKREEQFVLSIFIPQDERGCANWDWKSMWRDDTSVNRRGSV